VIDEQSYDLIIIGTGAGGGTLAYKLAPTGKKILILEQLKRKQIGVHLKCTLRSVTIHQIIGMTLLGKPFALK
jgi:choline dehydrogenase-like flavoprotein